MSCFDDIQWFLLSVIVMKVLILAAIAAGVIFVIAKRPCPDYCVYLVGDGRDLRINPECNCLDHTHTRIHGTIGESPILHQPASFPRIPEYLYPHPFYIFNPLMPQYLSDIDTLTPVSSRPPSSLRRHNSDIEISIDSAHGIVNGEEDDVQSNNQRPNAPLYLDINIESEDERSASRATITAEEREAIEQSLSECANIHALLFIKKADNTNLRKVIIADNISAANLENTIDHKCSLISKLVDKNVKEIKESRPKKTGNTFNINGEGEQEIEMPRSTNVHKINKQALCTSVTEGNLQAHFREVASTSAASTSKGKIPTSNIHPKIEDVTTITTERTWEQREHSTPISIENEYPYNTKTVSMHPTTQEEQELIESTIFVDIATTPTNIEEQGILKSQDKDQKLLQTNNEEERSEDRPQYNEGEVSLIKIITHEFSNNTVQSYVNGTEAIPNGDFNDEMQPIDVSNEFEKSSENITSSQASNEVVEANTSNANKDMLSEGDISGNLYFLFNSHQIPARFVQDNNGSLSVGIDGPSICNRLIAEGEHHSALLTTLCDCYKSGSCNKKKTNK